jgi:hypothetical protein
MGKSNILLGLIILILISFFQLTGISAQNNSVINDSIYSDILKELRSLRFSCRITTNRSWRYEVII